MFKLTLTNFCSVATYEFSLCTIAATIMRLFSCCGVKLGGGGGNVGGICLLCCWSGQFVNAVSSSTSGSWGILFELFWVRLVSEVSTSYWCEEPLLIENQRDSLPLLPWFWGEVSPGMAPSRDSLGPPPAPPLPRHNVRALFNVFRSCPLLLSKKKEKIYRKLIRLCYQYLDCVISLRIIPCRQFLRRSVRTIRQMLLVGCRLELKHGSIFTTLIKRTL